LARGAPRTDIFLALFELDSISLASYFPFRGPLSAHNCNLRRATSSARCPLLRSCVVSSRVSSIVSPIVRPVPSLPENFTRIFRPQTPPPPHPPPHTADPATSRLRAPHSSLWSRRLLLDVPRMHPFPTNRSSVFIF